MLEKGDAAPEFEMKDASGKSWRLTDLKGQKVILYFYPADDTPGCTKESCDFRDSSADLAKAGYIVLGVSPQGAASHQRFAEKYSLNFPLLVDEDLAATRSFGAYKELGDYEGIPLKVKRSTFVIDEDGRIELAEYGVRAKGHVEDLRSKLGVPV
ncbi:MAG TPA: peroxiredoxin [Actinomycetota bacterium]|nr:peroxiredoxin [Actinomycetota bacterium]